MTSSIAHHWTFARTHRSRGSPSSTRCRASSNDLADVERDARLGGVARARVARAFAARVGKNERSALEYVRLPVSEYNVLDDGAIRASDDGGFDVSAGTQTLLFLKVEPRGRVRVDARADGRGCTQRLVAAEMVNMNPGDLKSQAIVNALNASLKDVRLANDVTCERCADGTERIKVQITIAGDFTEGIFARAGGRLNTILGWSLGAVLPWFLTQLARDYERWAKGEPRSAKNASLAEVASKIIAGSRGKLPPGVDEVECEDVEL